MKVRRGRRRRFRYGVSNLGECSKEQRRLKRRGKRERKRNLNGGRNSGKWGIQGEKWMYERDKGKG